MSHFTNQFENEKIHIASSIDGKIGDHWGTVVVTSYNSQGTSYNDIISIYSPDGEIRLSFNKIQLLKAIQQTPVMGKIDD